MVKKKKNKKKINPRLLITTKPHFNNITWQRLKMKKQTKPIKQFTENYQFTYSATQKLNKSKHRSFSLYKNQPYHLLSCLSVTSYASLYYNLMQENIMIYGFWTNYTYLSGFISDFFLDAAAFERRFEAEIGFEFEFGGVIERVWILNQRFVKTEPKLGG